MTQRNDQVFQLSLTEIAFTIAFILLLLLGYLVVKEQAERRAAEAELEKVQSSERATQALDAAKDALRMTLQGTGVGSPDDVITKLIAAEDARAERDRLKKLVEDLDAKLTALEELRRRLDEVPPASRPGVLRDEVTSALALQDQVRLALEEADMSLPLAQRPAASAPLDTSHTAASGVDAAARPASAATVSEQSESKDVSSNPNGDSKSLRDPRRDAETLAKVRQAIVSTGELRRQLKAQLNKELAPGKEAETVRNVVSAAKGYGELAKAGVNPEQVRKENSDLRGQVAFLKNRLDARGGRDFPPCWADESGKVEFLFAVEVKPDLVVVTPAWPHRRDEAALHLPGIAEVLAGPHTNREFVDRILGIFNWSKTQDPECRHYVQLKSSIADAVQSDRARLMVENYFYKTEVRR